MASVNKVILVGNLCADPESKTFQNGGTICSLRVATSESWKDKSTGEKKERVEYHSVTLQGEGLAKVATSYLRKGSKVYIEGKLQTRKWQDQSGNDRYTTEIVVGMNGSLVMLDGAKGGDAQQRQNTSQSGGNTGGWGDAQDGLNDEIPW